MPFINKNSEHSCKISKLEWHDILHKTILYLHNFKFSIKLILNSSLLVLIPMKFRPFGSDFLLVYTFTDWPQWGDPCTWEYDWVVVFEAFNSAASRFMLFFIFILLLWSTLKLSVKKIKSHLIIWEKCQNSEILVFRWWCKYMYSAFIDGLGSLIMTSQWSVRPRDDHYIIYICPGALEVTLALFTPLGDFQISIYLSNILYSCW